MVLISLLIDDLYSTRSLILSIIDLSLIIRVLLAVPKKRQAGSIAQHMESLAIIAHSITIPEPTITNTNSVKDTSVPNQPISLATLNTNATLSIVLCAADTIRLACFVFQDESRET